MQFANSVLGRASTGKELDAAPSSALLAVECWQHLQQVMRSGRELFITAVSWTLNAHLHDSALICALSCLEERRDIGSGEESRRGEPQRVGQVGGVGEWEM